MKNSHKGFIVPLLLAIIAVLLIGGAVYVYQNNQPATPSANFGTQATSTTQTNKTTDTSSATGSNLNMAGGLCPEGQTYFGQVGKGSCVPLSTVPGMTKYTDTSFGFSFWYPTGWQVTSVQKSDTTTYVGGTILKEITLKSNTDTDKTMTVSEFTSPSRSITDNAESGCPGGHCSTTFRFYFDVSKGSWMYEIPFGVDPESGGGRTIAPGTIQYADVSNNTMGGLHIFNAGFRFADMIVPLSAHNFVVVSDEPLTIGPNFKKFLTETIVALDPAVAVQKDVETEIATIQAEAKAYLAN